MSIEAKPCGHAIPHEAYLRGLPQRLAAHSINELEWYRLRLEFTDPSLAGKRAGEVPVYVLEKQKTIIRPMLRLGLYDQDLTQIDEMEGYLELARGPRIADDNMLRIIGGRAFYIVNTDFSSKHGYLMHDDSPSIPTDAMWTELDLPVATSEQETVAV